jgi:hypothetical protein
LAAGPQQRNNFLTDPLRPRLMHVAKSSGIVFSRS